MTPQHIEEQDGEFGGETQLRIDCVEALIQNGFEEQTANEAFIALISIFKSVVAEAEQRGREEAVDHINMCADSVDIEAGFSLDRWRAILEEARSSKSPKT